MEKAVITLDTTKDPGKTDDFKTLHTLIHKELSTELSKFLKDEDITLQQHPTT